MLKHFKYTEFCTQLKKIIKKTETEFTKKKITATQVSAERIQFGIPPICVNGIYTRMAVFGLSC